MDMDSCRIRYSCFFEEAINRRCYKSLISLSCILWNSVEQNLKVMFKEAHWIRKTRLCLVSLWPAKQLMSAIFKTVLDTKFSGKDVSSQISLKKIMLAYEAISSRKRKRKKNITSHSRARSSLVRLKHCISLWEILILKKLSISIAVTELTISFL